MIAQQGAWACVPLLLLHLIHATAAYPSNSVSVLPSNSSAMYKSDYVRAGEVQQQCASYLGVQISSHPQQMEQSKKWSITHELSFFNGGWLQVRGNAPLMPFVPKAWNFSARSPGGRGGGGRLGEQEAAHLASLRVTDVDSMSMSSSSALMVNVSAVLQVGISTERALYYVEGNLQDAEVYPGFSVITIPMEGVYTEQQGNRMLCMVGSARLPARGEDRSSPWPWLDPRKNSHAFTVPTSEDHKLLAVFHFPKVLSLSSRAITGRLESFHAPANPQYFNPVDIYSELGPVANYHFDAGNAVDSACTNALHFPGKLPRPRDVYQGNGFCRFAERILSGQWMHLLPNWNCTLAEDICTKLGPFSNGSHAQIMDGGFDGTLLLVRDVRCVEYVGKDGSLEANVSAVFRAVLPSQNQNLAVERTGLDGLTLALEGRWSTSFGEICMVGCKGSGTSSEVVESHACDIKVLIYFPVVLSLKQRSLVQGSISSIHNTSGYFYPLSFFLPLNPTQVPRDVIRKLVYEYTQISEAGALLERYEPVGFGEKIKKSFLAYPSASNGLMNLIEDLSVHVLAITNPDSLKGVHFKHSVSFDILAIEDHMSLDWVPMSELLVAPSSAVDEETEKVEEQKDYYKIAAQLMVRNSSGDQVIAVSAEGEYDPMVGRMFLVGCREVNAPWKTFHENAELLENGFDCMLEVSVRYPPTNTRWLVNPTVKFTVTSKRPEDDPLFFSAVELETFPTAYKMQREEFLSRRSFEGGLTLITLSLIVTCIVSQLGYVKSHVDSTPYVSLLMLGVQAAGFSIPLITGMEALFARMTSDVGGIQQSTMMEGKWTEMIGYGVKVLSLVSLLITFRIARKVVKSRIRLGTQRPLEPWRVPSDKRVLAICTSIHGIGFIIALTIHSMKTAQRPISTSVYMDSSGSLHKQHEWKQVLLEYYGCVQDLFLLPQVVGYHMWDVKGKPLSIAFYVGITVLRLLPHVYDRMRSPVFNPYFADEYEYANPSLDFYSKAGDIAIPLLAVLLAMVVYAQQRWNGLTLDSVFRTGSSKLLLLGSCIYERVPSKTFEAEMVESAPSAKQISETGHEL